MRANFLNSVSSFFVFGFVLLGTLAAGSLVSAIRNAEDGFEDEYGFHRDLDPQNIAMG